ncbi:MAG: aspartyl protease family protein, partial [Alphaproteobacteria bacterium]|nr:aspartyl protease family protein [Alphaproteobacteria bacterium]
AQEGCNLTRAASLDMTIESSGRIIVPVGIGGKTRNFLIDTGGLLSSISSEIVDAEGMRRDSIGNERVMMFGGERIKSFTVGENIDIGGLHAPRLSLLILPPHHMEAGTDGILGQDILRAYDDDFDFANARFNLFVPNKCSGSVVYWAPAAPYAEIPFTNDDNGHISLPLELDGHRVQSILDTGAWRTTMRLEYAMSAYGLKQSDLKPYSDTTDTGVFKYPFKSLTIGGVTVSNPDVVLVPNAAWGRFNTGPDLILGMGVLRQLHLYIAYKQKRLFVTSASAH